jgi:GNAT superfamily N-acetyltransferase
MAIPTFAVRTARKDDAFILSGIHKDAWLNGFAHEVGVEVAQRAVAVRCSPMRWTKFLEAAEADDETILIGEVDGEPGGLIQLGFADDGDAEVLRMYVATRFWRKGLGRTLMETAYEWFRARDVEEVLVWSADTPQARRFYEGCGFEADGTSHEQDIIDDIVTTSFGYRRPL